MLTEQELAFFNGFHDFDVKPSSTRQAEFQRLATVRSWAKGGKIHRRQQRALDAIIPMNDNNGDDLAARLDTLCINSNDDKWTTAGKPVTVQAAFAAIARKEGLKPKSDAYDDRYAEFMAEEIRAHYGSNSAWKLGILQAICRDVGVDEIPGSVTKCRKVLRTVHVNIYDWLNCKRSGRQVAPVFKNFLKLKAYTLNKHRFFPKKLAKRSPILKFLLKQFFPEDQDD